jgi:S1-C subfamily serine protease
MGQHGRVSTPGGLGPTPTEEEWRPPFATPSPGRRPDRSVVLVAVVAAVLAATGLGLVVGHLLWVPADRLGFNSSGITPPSFGFPLQPGTGLRSRGAPADSAALAAAIDPALVDINTADAYEALQGAGTGMVLTSTGEVLTNNHVVEGATTIRVTDVGNGQTYSATVVGYDRSHDVAVLQLDGATDLQTVRLGDSSRVHTGQGVVVVGNTEGLGGTPSYAGGEVTGTHRTILAEDAVIGGAERLGGLIETDADILAGDSGGPLVDGHGRVVGMVTAGSEGFQFQSGQSQGYAIPISRAIAIARQIEAGLSSTTVHVGPTALLGVTVETPPAGGAGAQVVGVVPGGPADAAGIAPGDVIVGLDRRRVGSPEALTDLLIQRRPGDVVRIRYRTASGGRHTVSVRLTGGPPQ